jgi:SAM-dependent methyltransferase
MAKRRKKEWFDDDSFWVDMYPLLFPEKRFADAFNQIDKILQLVKPRGKMVLDLCCGPGRCSIALAKRGFVVTGVDRTEFLLKKAKTRARAARVKIEWVKCDMRDFVRPEGFDLVLSMFTSFGYFDAKDADSIVLSNMFASLKSGGACLIDVVGKEWLARVFQPTNSEKLPDGTTVVQRHEIFDNWNRIRNEWILIRKGHSKAYMFHHTVYSGQELIDRMQQAGFADIVLYGNLDGDEYGPNACRLIAVGRKARS